MRLRLRRLSQICPRLCGPSLSDEFTIKTIPLLDGLGKYQLSHIEIFHPILMHRLLPAGHALHPRRAVLGRPLSPACSGPHMKTHSTACSLIQGPFPFQQLAVEHHQREPFVLPGDASRHPRSLLEIRQKRSKDHVVYHGRSIFILRFLLGKKKKQKTTALRSMMCCYGNTRVGRVPGTRYPVGTTPSGEVCLAQCIRALQADSGLRGCIWKKCPRL